MKDQIIRLSFCVVLLLNGIFLFAGSSDKEKAAEDKPAVIMIQSELPSPPPGEMGMPLPPPGEGPGFPGTFAFISMEMETSDKQVKDAPYSAQAITEKVQNLADGNRIVHQNTASLYRDSQGRTRREQEFGALGFWVAEKDPPQTIFINDPVAGVSYILNPKDQVAHKLLPKVHQNMPPPGPPGHTFEMKIPPGGGFHKVDRFYKNDADKKTEPLGKQVIEGVEAEGTRTIVTIPAGEIGNELPIQIVSEKWYSPELQITVMTKNSDPRFGETTYRLVNIKRAEPEASLFEVPAGYKIEK